MEDILRNESTLKAGCEKCEQRGHIRQKKQPIGWNAIPCECMYEYEDKKRILELINLSNIPKRILLKNPIVNSKHHEIDYHAFFQTMLVFDKRYDIEQNWVYVHGAVGTGKTYLAILAAQAALYRKETVYFTTVADLLDSLRPNRGEEETDKMEWYKSAQLLILDDIGQEKASEWVREKLYVLINYRWNHGYPTFFTSNKPLENLKSTISEAVYSRVRGKAYVIKIESEDKRIPVT